MRPCQHFGFDNFFFSLAQPFFLSPPLTRLPLANNDLLDILKDKPRKKKGKGEGQSFIIIFIVKQQAAMPFREKMKRAFGRSSEEDSHLTPNSSTTAQKQQQRSPKGMGMGMGTGIGGMKKKAKKRESSSYYYYKNKNKNDSSTSGSTTRRRQNVYKPGERMPKPKYPAVYNKAHQEKLLAFSFGDAWKKRNSCQSQYSPMGSRWPSARTSVARSNSRKTSYDHHHQNHESHEHEYDKGDDDSELFNESPPFVR